MLKSIAPRSLPTEKAGAWLLLVIAGAILISFQASTTGFFDDAHGFLSSDAMSWARNMAVGDGHGVMYEAAYLDEQAQVTYVIYHRFPPTVYWLISIICRATPENLTTQIMLARQLMNVSVWVAMVASFGTLVILGVPSLGAVSAVLLTFSSRYLLNYSDMVFHNSPTLAGISLLFLAIAAHHRGRASIWHVCLASMVAVSLGWQAYAVVGAWWLIQVAVIVVTESPRSLRRILARVLHAPASICLAATLVWGVAILAYLMLSEWRMLGGSLFECPSFRSMVYRLTGEGGAGGSSVAQSHRFVAWPGFIARQAHRILGMLTPVAFLTLALPMQGVIGIILLALSSLWVRLRVYRMYWPIWSSIALSGIIWAVVMRHYVAFHDLESIFYIGIPLTFWGLLALWLHSIRKGRAWRIVAVLCLALYVINVSQMNQIKNLHNQQANKMTEQFQVMQPLLGYGKAIYIDPSTEKLELPPNAMLYYVAGNYQTALSQAKYAISVDPVAGAQKLTNNSQVNLYQMQ